MAATIQINGGNTTVTFTYTKPSVKLNPVLLNAAEYLWEHGYGDHGTEEEELLFSNLTVQQKLNLIDQHIRIVVLNAAKTHYSVSEQDAARDAAEIYAQENMDL